jgi:hypothetical protein
MARCEFGEDWLVKVVVTVCSGGNLIQVLVPIYQRARISARPRRCGVPDDHYWSNISTHTVGCAVLQMTSVFPSPPWVLLPVILISVEVDYAV